jgi:DNA invertase Pin-like site-specific DNA recombinase
MEKLKNKGLPATEIAKALGISYNTVRRRLKNSVKRQTGFGSIK